MYSDIRSGKINMVIVKDFSRFGRHYVETGMYVQRFTEQNVRFIAADDGCNKISKTFREERVFTPFAYFNKHNPDYIKSDYRRKEFDWHVTSIRAILENEVYLGQLVYGKRRNKSIKSKEKVKNPREDRIVAENCHEPIITQELWDTVHKILRAKHRSVKTDEVQMFAGLLYCTDCGTPTLDNPP